MFVTFLPKKTETLAEDAQMFVQDCDLVFWILTLFVSVSALTAYTYLTIFDLFR